MVKILCWREKRKVQWAPNNGEDKIKFNRNNEQLFYFTILTNSNKILFFNC